jgi:hypothetical protein
MNEIQIGQNVKVKFNGHMYPGQVLEVSAKRFKVRFTTGSGKTRQTWFRRDRFAMTGIAGAYANTAPRALDDSIAPGVLLLLDERRRALLDASLPPKEVANG